MNKRTRRIEVTFNLTFDDYYVKRVKNEFPHKPILSNSNGDIEQMLNFDIEFDLIFGILDRAIDVEVNIKDNQVPKASNHFDDFTVTDGRLNRCITLKPSALVEEGQTLISNPVDWEQLPTQSQVEGEPMTLSDIVEGE